MKKMQFSTFPLFLFAVVIVVFNLKMLAGRRVLARALGVRQFATPANLVRIYETNTTDPNFNLSYEECLLRHQPTAQHTLFLWRNKPCVIFGRFQNPYKECFVDKIQAAGVELVRRQSGGGTVYQDLGNSIFSFIDADNKTQKDRNSAVLIAALKELGIKAEASGRNDITVDGKKVSGSAFRRERGLFLHHGTMLLSVDFTALAGFLNPNKAKLQSKGVSSVAARVMNLCSIVPSLDHDKWNKALIRAYLDSHGLREGDVAVEKVGLENSTPELQEIYKDFTHNIETRFDWGIMDVHINSIKGLIADVKIFSDSLIPQMIETLEKELKGCKYDKQAISEACARARRVLVADKALAETEVGKHVDEFAQWLITQL